MKLWRQFKRWRRNRRWADLYNYSPIMLENNWNVVRIQLRLLRYHPINTVHCRVSKIGGEVLSARFLLWGTMATHVHRNMNTDRLSDEILHQS